MPRDRESQQAGTGTRQLASGRPCARPTLTHPEVVDSVSLPSQMRGDAAPVPGRFLGGWWSIGGRFVVAFDTPELSQPPAPPTLTHPSPAMTFLSPKTTATNPPPNHTHAPSPLAPAVSLRSPARPSTACDPPHASLLSHHQCPTTPANPPSPPKTPHRSCPASSPPATSSDSGADSGSSSHAAKE